MRQWNLPTVILCRNHLLGEHHEIHYAWGYLKKSNRALEYWTSKGFVETSSLQKRHDQLVQEMLSRGYNHFSPLPKLNKRIPNLGKIDLQHNLKDLLGRCSSCKSNYDRYYDFKEVTVE